FSAGGSRRLPISPLRRKPSTGEEPDTPKRSRYPLCLADGRPAQTSDRPGRSRPPRPAGAVGAGLPDGVLGGAARHRQEPRDPPVGAPGRGRRPAAAGPLLAATSCRFVIPVPSRDVRRFLEAARDRRARRPAHAREREDAPPHLLRELWEHLAGVAPRLGIDAVREGSRPLPYDPALYGRIYRRVL